MAENTIQKRKPRTSPQIIRLSQVISKPENFTRYKTLKELLISLGYSEMNAQANASQILAKPAVRQLLANIFTEENAKAVVSEILINGQEQNRLKSAELMFKVLGSFAPVKVESKSVVAHILADIQNEDNSINIPEENGDLSRTTDTGNQEAFIGSDLEIKQSILDNQQAGNESEIQAE